MSLGRSSPEPVEPLFDTKTPTDSRMPVVDEPVAPFQRTIQELPRIPLRLSNMTALLGPAPRLGPPNNVSIVKKSKPKKKSEATKHGQSALGAQAVISMERFQKNVPMGARNSKLAAAATNVKFAPADDPIEGIVSYNTNRFLSAPLSSSAHFDGHHRAPGPSNVAAVEEPSGYSDEFETDDRDGGEDTYEPSDSYFENPRNDFDAEFVDAKYSAAEEVDNTEASSSAVYLPVLEDYVPPSGFSDMYSVAGDNQETGDDLASNLFTGAVDEMLRQFQNGPGKSKKAFSSSSLLVYEAQLKHEAAELRDSLMAKLQSLDSI
jgi:hypothetical protein